VCRILSKLVDGFFHKVIKKINRGIRETFSRHRIGMYICVRCSHWDEIVINRLRIGHTRWTHSYLLTGADQPECTTCQCPLTVKHILFECSDSNDTRSKYFVASSMEELFRTVDVRNVLGFIRETNFYNKL